MKKQIFISYSRKDLAVVEPFVKEIEARTGLRCWIDWTGIESGAKFEKKIVEAIDQVDVVLFFLSDNSMASDYTEMEISYAYNTKKRVVPVMLDGGQLRGWFLFKFGSINFIDCNESRQVDTLMSNLVTWCGGCVPQPKPQPVKTYKVGDYFDDGQKQGVVFEVSQDGRHGKIVSLVQECLEWCKRVEYNRYVQTKAIDMANGMLNQRLIEQVVRWRMKYPAFVWCADLGNGWYLPAVEELKKLLLDDVVHEKLNRTLQERGATQLFSKGEWKWYWSSTEYDELYVWYVGLYGKDTYLEDKDIKQYVRAVAQF